MEESTIKIIYSLFDEVIRADDNGVIEYVAASVLENAIIEFVRIGTLLARSEKGKAG